MLNEVVSYIEQCETVRSSASKSSINQPSQRAAWSSFSSPLFKEARLPLHSPLAAIQAITDLSLSLIHPVRLQYEVLPQGSSEKPTIFPPPQKRVYDNTFPPEPIIFIAGIFRVIFAGTVHGGTLITQAYYYLS